MNAIEYTPKFELGRTVATPAALELFTQDEIFTMFQRHHSGDWGDTCEDDKKMNDEALKYDNRILSVYKQDKGRTCWIITEADRSATTVLLPDEY